MRGAHMYIYTGDADDMPSLPEITRCITLTPCFITGGPHVHIAINVLVLTLPSIFDV